MAFVTRIITPVFRLLAAVVCLAVPLGAQVRGYTLADIQDLLGRGYAERRILALASQRCLGFALGPQAAAQLRRAGASEQLVRDLGSVCSRLPAERATPPRAVARPPSVAELISRGNQLRSRPDAAGALRLYRQAASREPANASAHHGIGLALRDQRLFSEALPAFQRAAELRPDEAELHADVASALNGLRRFREAEPHAREAVRLRPNEGSGHFQLGVARAGMERPYDAQEALAAAVRIAPGRAEYRTELQRVESRMNFVGASKRAYDIPEISSYIEFVRFYSSPTTTNWQSVPRYRLPRDSVRSVAYEVGLRHPNPSQRTEFKIVAVFYNPDGGEWFRDTLTRSVSRDTIHLGDSDSQYRKGWSSDTPGQWPAGTYRVDFLHQGERVASSAFELVDTEAVDIPSAGGRVTMLRFFEGGAVRPSGINQRYQYRFSASTSRYLYVAVELAFPARAQRVDLPLQAIYYAPDGREAGRITFSESYVPVGAAGTFPYRSLGFAVIEAGKWPTGRYRVDVMANSRRIASGWFDMY